MWNICFGKTAYSMHQQYHKIWCIFVPLQKASLRKTPYKKNKRQNILHSAATSDKR